MGELTRRKFLGGSIGGGAALSVLSWPAATYLERLGIGVEARAAAAPPAIAVRLWGRSGAITSFPNALPSGEAVTKVLNGWTEFPAGTSIACGTVASDGRVFFGVAGHSGAFGVNGDGQRAAVLKPDADTLQCASSFITIPTSSDDLVTYEFASATEMYGQGGADTSDACIFIDAAGIEHVMLSSGVAYHGWKINTVGTTHGYGVYPTLALLTKDNGTWAPDPKSRTADQLYAYSDNNLGETLFPSKSNADFLGAESVRMSNVVSEIDVFPNGDVVATQYFQVPGHTSAQVFVFDTSGYVVAAYQFPDFRDVRAPGGPPLKWSCRSVTTDPTATDPTDQRFFVLPDMFANDPIGISGVQRVGNYATFTTTANHGFGVGQFPTIAGFTHDTSYNSPGGAAVVNPIESVPAANTFTLYIEGPDDNFGFLGTSPATAQLRQQAPVVELRYNAVTHTITPVSMPCHIDEHQLPIGTVSVDQLGNAILNPYAVTHNNVGALSVWKMGSDGKRTNERLAPYDPATFANSWGTVVHPDVAFGGTAGAGAATSSTVHDPHDSTTYWLSGDNLRRVASWDPVAQMGNLGFEGPVFDASKWSYFNATGTRVANPDPARPGSSCLQVTATAGTAIANPQCTGAKVPVVPGERYYVEAWIKNTSSSPVACTARIGLQWRGANDAVSNDNSFGVPVVLDSGWVKVSADLPAPTTGWFGQPPPATAQLLVTVAMDATGQSPLPQRRFLVDDLRFTKGELAPNPEFDTDPTGWASAAGFSVERVAPSPNGTPCLRIFGTGLSPSARSAALPAPLATGQSYDVKASLRSSDLPGWVAVGLEWWNGGSLLMSRYGAPVRITSGGWTEAIASLAAPPSTAWAASVSPCIAIKTMHMRPSSGGTRSVLVDSVSCRRGAGVNLADVKLQASTLPRGGTDGVAEGTLMAARPVLDARNPASRKIYIPVMQWASGDRGDPSFERNSNVWKALDAETTLSPATTSTHDAFAGTKALRVTGSYAATPTLADCRSTEVLPVLVGKSYPVEGWFKADATAATATGAAIGLRWFDASGVKISDSWSSPSSLTTAWQRRTARLIAPANAAKACLIAKATLGSASGAFFLDDVSFNPSYKLDQYVFELSITPSP